MDLLPIGIAVHNAAAHHAQPDPSAPFYRGRLLYFIIAYFGFRILLAFSKRSRKKEEKRDDSDKFGKTG